MVIMQYFHASHQEEHKKKKKRKNTTKHYNTTAWYWLNSMQIYAQFENWIKENRVCVHACYDPCIYTSETNWCMWLNWTVSIVFVVVVVSGLLSIFHFIQMCTCESLFEYRMLMLPIWVIARTALCALALRAKIQKQNKNQPLIFCPSAYLPRRWSRDFHQFAVRFPRRRARFAFARAVWTTIDERSSIGRCPIGFSCRIQWANCNTGDGTFRTIIREEE